MSFPTWTPVTDRLPDHDNDVLVVLDGVEPSIGWLSGRSKEWRMHGSETGTVTHWMPLPDPPDAGKAADATGGEKS